MILSAGALVPARTLAHSQLQHTLDAELEASPSSKAIPAESRRLTAAGY